jgi:pyruvate/2-oxoglutarate/acetoin dehydrogenase E1 component
MARSLSMHHAVMQAIDEEMAADPRVVMIGQTVTPFDEHFNPGIADLARKYAGPRIRPTGIVERLQAGAGVGAALAGLRPVVDLTTAAFGSLAYDEVFAKAALWTYEHGGSGGMSVPIVFRATYTGYGTSGAEHSRAPLATYMHGVGLATVVPTTPADAKGLMKNAIRADGPVVFLEPAPLSGIEGPVPDGDDIVPFGVAAVRREGSDCTVAAVGYQVTLALDAAAVLAREGISAEVIDLRTLSPLDLETVLASVRKTGRLVECDEDFARCGIGAELAYLVQESAFGALAAPVRRVAPHYPSPAAPVLNAAVMPSVRTIARAVRQACGKDPGEELAQDTAMVRRVQPYPFGPLLVPAAQAKES